MTLNTVWERRAQSRLQIELVHWTAAAVMFEGRLTKTTIVPQRACDLNMSGAVYNWRRIAKPITCPICVMMYDLSPFTPGKFPK